jgi:phosphatidate cytidylyltransferase
MNRLVTAAIGIPATILLIWFAPGWIFALVLAAAAAICMEEFMTLGAACMGSRPGRWVLAPVAVVTLSFSMGPRAGLIVLSFTMIFTLAVTAFSESLPESLPKAALASMGIAYCGLLLGFVLLLRRDMVLVLLGILWVGDAAALYGGRMLGKHPLAPTISPRKTVEGAFAGIIASVIAGVTLGVWLAGESPGALVAGSIIAAGAGQLGDLAESALKRSAGTKESSPLLPGHGGMLDRLDGLLFAAPVFYWFFMR